MGYIKGINQFRKIFFTPRVFIFILTGIIVMFLTFLTRENAWELAISGVASIFIGIGVNNFTAIETTLKEERQLQQKMQQTIKTLMNLEEKVAKMQSLYEASPEFMTLELKEMLDYIELCIQYLREEL